VEDGRVEIGVVADSGRQQQPHVGDRHEQPPDQLSRAHGGRFVFRQQLADRVPERGHRRPSEGHESVQRSVAACVGRIGRAPGEQVRVERGDDVENPVTDRHPDAAGAGGLRRKDAEWQVLDREVTVRLLCRRDP
jgi:hypothetical protein